MMIAMLSVAAIGLLTGFVFSIPAAGPVMLLIVSNGLKGKLRFSERVAYGAALADFVYAFVGVYAFAQLYELYKPYTPYILGVGAVFLGVLAVKMLRTEIDLEQLDDHSLLKDKLRNKGGFRIGLAINFLNPSLFVGWLASAFISLALASAVGLDTGGLNVQMADTMQEMEQVGMQTDLQEHTSALRPAAVAVPSADGPDGVLLSSLVFAVGLALGSTLWFYLLAHIVVAQRGRFRVATIETSIRVMAIVLLGVGLFFGYEALVHL